MSPLPSQSSDQLAAEPKDRAPLDGWGTLRRFIPYLWPADRPDLKRRIAGAMLFVLLAKATTLTLPYVYKRAIDAMTTPANAAAMAAMAFVIAYALGRLAAVTFDNLRNITFEKVGQDATRVVDPGHFRAAPPAVLALPPLASHRRGDQDHRARHPQHRHDALFPALQHRADDRRTDRGGGDLLAATSAPGWSRRRV